MVSAVKHSHESQAQETWSIRPRPRVALPALWHLAQEENPPLWSARERNSSTIISGAVGGYIWGEEAEPHDALSTVWA